MTFDDILDQAIEMLQRRRRLTYRTLKVQFNLGDDLLEVLKEEFIYGQRLAVDEDERVLVWTGDPPAAQPDAQRVADADTRFHTLLPAVIGWLQRDKRVMYRELKHIFGLHDVLLEEIREALTFKQLARDENGKGLVWIGETPPMTPSVGAVPSLPDTIDATAVPSPTTPPLPSPVTEPRTPSNRPTGPAEALPTAVPQDEPVVVSELSRSAPEAERRQLTVMFCDLADSTKLSQQLDPEDLRDVVRAYQATAAEVIEQYEGHLAQYLGDGLLIYFGWPIAHEDDAQRALHAGLGIVEAIATRLNPRLQQEKGVQLTVRLGVHTGPVVVGEMGGGGRHENLATGETVNIAARLEGLAAPNTVVISHVTARLVRAAFALKDLGPHALKGVAEPIQVFRVLASMEDPEDATAVVGVSFLVGRDEEVRLLLRRWEQAKESLGQVVLISGPAGIGKSSLTQVLRAHVREEGMPRIAFRCSPYHQNSALYPVITHVEQLLDFQREDTPETKLDKLEQGLQGYSLPLDEVVPLLATLLSVPLHDRYPKPMLTPQQQKQQTLDMLVGWMLEEAERQPVLVAWEDLHWADPSTLEMLGLVLEQTPTVPMLHVLTYRPEFEPPWPSRSHMTPITLSRLERPQVEALIAHQADGKMLPDEVVQHIVTKTDGVPLYVEELTKMLLESDLLYEEADQYVLTGPLLSVAIPDTLQDSLMARLDQMNTAKGVAQLGAVLGREFAYDMLQVISTQDDETLQAGLAKLVEAELLYQRGRPPRAKYIFKHALIQDTAYASLLRSTRQQVHQQVAQLLETQFPDILETQPELVAHHYTEAGLAEQAIGYWHRAGEVAKQRSAYTEAIHHFTKGLEVVDTLPETPARHLLELDLRIALGPELMAAKGYSSPEVEHTYTRARELCQQVGETPQLFPALWGLWLFSGIKGEYHAALDLAEQLLRLAQRFQDPALLLQAHHAMWMTLFHHGDLTSVRAHCQQGRQLYEPDQHHAQTYVYGNHDPGVCARGFGCRTLWFLGYPDQARQMCGDMLTLARQLKHPLSLVQAHAWATWVHAFCGEHQLALEQAEATVALAAKRGIPYWTSQGTMLRGWLHAATGEVETGLTQLHQGLEAFQSIRAGSSSPWYLSLLAEAHGIQGQIDLGLRAIASGLDAVNQRELFLFESELYRLKGELLLKPSCPDVSQAEACFHKAFGVARAQQAKSLELRAATSLARLWQFQDKRQEACDLLAPVYGWFTEGFDTADLREAKTLLDELR